MKTVSPTFDLGIFHQHDDDDDEEFTRTTFTGDTITSIATVGNANASRFYLWSSTVDPDAIEKLLDTHGAFASARRDAAARVPIRIVPIFLLVIIAFLVNLFLDHAFLTHNISLQFLASSSSSTSTSPAGLHFQLEEMEDGDKCITEMKFNYDGTITIGESDGPPFRLAKGKWKQQEDGSIVFNIIRTYKAGNDARKQTDVGEFEYTVERQFTGNPEWVGSKLNFQGVVHLIDEVLGDEEVGYFEMIDVADVK